VAVLSPESNLLLKHGHIHETAFVEVKFAFFVPSIPGDDAQRLVFSDRGIATHGLIIHSDSAVHPAASYQVPENVGDVVALIPEAIVGAHDLPAFILGAHLRAEDSGANREQSESERKDSNSSCKLHRKLLRGGCRPSFVSL
jgi:hypothetical protein